MTPPFWAAEMSPRCSLTLKMPQLWTEAPSTPWVSSAPLYNTAPVSPHLSDLTLLSFVSRLHRARGADGNRTFLPGVPGLSFQSSVSDSGAQRPVQRGQPETGWRHFSFPVPSVSVLSAQTCSQVPRVAAAPVRCKNKIKKNSFHLYQLLFHKVQQRTYTQFLCSTVIDCSGSVVLGTVQSSWH